MNYTKDVNGKRVIAIGAPNSLARAKCEGRVPREIEVINPGMENFLWKVLVSYDNGAFELFPCDTEIEANAMANSFKQEVSL